MLVKIHNQHRKITQSNIIFNHNFISQRLGMLLDKELKRNVIFFLTFPLFM